MSDMERSPTFRFPPGSWEPIHLYLLNCHYDTYTNIRNALAYHATSADDFSSLASLPANPSDTTLYPVSMAEAAALGLISPDSVIDAYVGFGSNVPFDYAAANGGSTSVPSGQYDFLGVLSHEVTEIMGRVLLCGAAPPGGGPAQFGPLDIFHYSSPGVRDSSAAQPGYFSPDGGVTNLGDFNTELKWRCRRLGNKRRKQRFLGFCIPGCGPSADRRRHA